MMKSVALLDSVPSQNEVEDDFVLVESDFEHNDDEDHGNDGDDDNDSYDYCEDALSLSSSAQHPQATILTATSNPLHVVQENFFAVAASSTGNINDNDNLASFDHGEDDDDDDDGNENEEGKDHPLDAVIHDAPNQLGNSKGGQELDKILPTTMTKNLKSPSELADDPTLGATVIAKLHDVDDEELSSFLASSTSQLLSEQEAESLATSEQPGQVKTDKDCNNDNEQDEDPIMGKTMHSTQEGEQPTTAATEAEEFDVSPLSIVAALSTSSTTTTTISNQEPSYVVDTKTTSDINDAKDKTKDLVGDEKDENSQATSSSSSRAQLSSSMSSKSTMTGSCSESGKNKKKRRKQLKIAKKAAAAAAAAAALGQLTALKPKGASPKRKSCRNNKKVANIAVAEAVKSHQEYNQAHLGVKSSTNKKLR